MVRQKALYNNKMINMISKCFRPYITRKFQNQDLLRLYYLYYFTKTIKLFIFNIRGSTYTTQYSMKIISVNK